MSSCARRGLRLSQATAGLLTVLALVSVSVGLSAADRDDPIRTEEVVRMLVGGVPTDEILVAIRSRPALFDVSPDMQEELRLAGVSDELIQAMVDRMAELTPAPEPVDDLGEEPKETAVAPPALRIWLDPQPENGKPKLLRVRGVVDSRLREAWQLDAEAEETPFEDLALFVVCRTATHVPDHWRSNSPLGRDFISMPRHRLLLFLTAKGEDREGGVDKTLELELPPSLEIELLPGEAHDLSLGLALQVAGRYLRWTDDTWDELTPDPEGTEIRAEVRGGRNGKIGGLEVRFNRNPPSPESE